MMCCAHCGGKIEVKKTEGGYRAECSGPRYVCGEPEGVGPEAKTPVEALEKFHGMVSQKYWAARRLEQLTGQPVPREWFRIDEAQPAEEQDVYYFFGLNGKVYPGKYNRYVGEHCREDAYSNCFFGPGGFLTDDVTYWMPRGINDDVPPPPSQELWAKDLYFPFSECED